VIESGGGQFSLPGHDRWAFSQEGDGETARLPRGCNIPALFDQTGAGRPPSLVDQRVWNSDVTARFHLRKKVTADLLGISRQHLYDLIDEKKPVSPAVAVRLGKLFGNGPGTWLRMQTAYDLWHAEREVDTSGIKTILAA
jgi:addiction module HigA family antidote